MPKNWAATSEHNSWRWPRNIHALVMSGIHNFIESLFGVNMQIDIQWIGVYMSVCVLMCLYFSSTGVCVCVIVFP